MIDERIILREIETRNYVNENKISHSYFDI